MKHLYLIVMARTQILEGTSEEIPLQQRTRCPTLGTRKRLRFSEDDQSASNERRVLEAVEKNNELLLSLVGRVKRTEKRLKTIERQVDSTSPSSEIDSTPGKRSTRKKDVPIEVRVRIC